MQPLVTAFAGATVNVRPEKTKAKIARIAMMNLFDLALCTITPSKYYQKPRIKILFAI